MSTPTMHDFDPQLMAPLPPEMHPSVDDLVTENDAPVANIYSEKQLRLLTRPLYSSWPGPQDDPRFSALANVGLFFALDEPPIVPDVLLSLRVNRPGDLSMKQNRSYFIWVFGKFPDAVVEIVSNREGGELSFKRVK
jgi:hypothetical protein